MATIRHRIRKIRKVFWKSKFKTGEDPFSLLRQRYQKSELTVRLFYAFNFFVWISYLRGSSFYFENFIVAYPAWPIFWVTLHTAPYWAQVFFIMNLVGAVLGFVFPWLIWARISAFIGLFFFTAILNSDVMGWERFVCHTYHFVLVSFLFIFLPKNNLRKRIVQWRTVYLVILAQITILSAYSSSAIHRLRMSVWQLTHGDPLSIGWNSFSRSIRFFSVHQNSTGIFSEFLLKHGDVSGPLMAIATVFELLALFVMFRPSLYRSYGILLGLFHLGFVLSLNLAFNEQLYLVLIFLVASPL